MKKFRKYVAMVPGFLGFAFVWIGGALIWCGAKIEGGLIIGFREFMKAVMNEGL